MDAWTLGYWTGTFSIFVGIPLGLYITWRMLRWLVRGLIGMSTEKVARGAGQLAAKTERKSASLMRAFKEGWDNSSRP